MTATVIVGGGLSGGGAAALLASPSRRVLLVEREAGPVDKICGEFISAEGLRHLAAIGLDVGRLGAQPITHLRLACGERLVAAPLPFIGAALTRRRLDAALLELAESRGARVERGVTVARLGGETLETNRGDMRSDGILLATGKHDLRGARRDTSGTRKGLVGFKRYFRVDSGIREAMRGAVELVLFPGGYAGMNIVEDGSLNLCLLVSRDRFAELGRRWEALFAALLREPFLQARLGAAEALGARPISIADVPYGYRYAPTGPVPPNLYRLGDQAAVIPSFSGDGMSIALHSARVAAKAVGDGWRPAQYHARLRADLGGVVRTAMRIQRLVDFEPARPVFMTWAKFAPGLLTQLAARTRVSARALRRSGLAADQPRRPVLGTGLATVADP